MRSVDQPFRCCWRFYPARRAEAAPALTALIRPNALNAGTGPGKSYIGVRPNAVLSIGKIGGAVVPSTLPAGCVEALEDCSREAHHVVAGNARIALGAIALRRENQILIIVTRLDSEVTFRKYDHGELASTHREWLFIVNSTSNSVVLQHNVRPGLRPYIHPLRGPERKSCLTEDCPWHHL